MWRRVSRLSCHFGVARAREHAGQELVEVDLHWSLLVGACARGHNSGILPNVRRSVKLSPQKDGPCSGSLPSLSACLAVSHCVSLSFLSPSLSVALSLFRSLFSCPSLRSLKGDTGRDAELCCSCSRAGGASASIPGSSAHLRLSPLIWQLPPWSQSPLPTAPWRGFTDGTVVIQ